MVAVPAETAVTTPPEDTVATDVLLEIQVTVFSVAFEGITVEIKVSNPPSVKFSELLFNVTLETPLNSP